MSKPSITIPVPSELQLDSWQTEANQLSYDDGERERHIAKRAAAWGAAMGVDSALKDLQSHFWRVTSNDEHGAQLVRVADLVSWVVYLRDRAVNNDVTT